MFLSAPSFASGGVITDSSRDKGRYGRFVRTFESRECIEVTVEAKVRYWTSNSFSQMFGGDEGSGHTTTVTWTEIDRCNDSSVVYEALSHEDFDNSFDFDYTKGDGVRSVYMTSSVTVLNDEGEPYVTVDFEVELLEQADSLIATEITENQHERPNSFLMKYKVKNKDIEAGITGQMNLSYHTKLGFGFYRLESASAFIGTDKVTWKVIDY